MLVLCCVVCFLWYVLVQWWRTWNPSEEQSRKELFRGIVSKVSYCFLLQKSVCVLGGKMYILWYRILRIISCDIIYIYILIIPRRIAPLVLFIIYVLRCKAICLTTMYVPTSPDDDCYYLLISLQRILHSCFVLAL